MNLALTQDQILIRDTAESFLAEHSDSAAVRSAMALPSGYRPEVWRMLATELGWCGTAIDEAQGGLGLGQTELVLLFEQMGRRLFGSPFFATVGLGATLVQELAVPELQRSVLAGVAAGTLRLGVALPQSLRWTAAGQALQARRGTDGWVLEGRVACVVDGASCDRLLLFANAGDEGWSLFLVPSDAPGVEARSLQTWDATRRLVELRLGRVSAAARLDGSGVTQTGVLRAAARARLYLAAELLGVAQACLDLSVAYTGTRRQFGRVVAGFQAVKHRCAEMMVRVESLRSAVYGAAALASSSTVEPAELDAELAGVRALASDTAFCCAQEAIQLHGGVGFTWDYDPQLYFKRAQASAGWLGTAEQLRERVAQFLFDSHAQ